jgi:hypothetical protein
MVGDGAPGSGRGTEVRVGFRTGVPRSGCRHHAWLVAGADLASAGCRASGTCGVDLRASPWPEAVAQVVGVAVFGARRWGRGGAAERLASTLGSG